MIANGMEEKTTCVTCPCEGMPVMKALDTGRIERAVVEILEALGEDPGRDGLKDTPGRVARAYAELFAGMREDPAVHLGRVFEQDGDEAVILRDIAFNSMCEHHLLPFVGRAHVAYLPSGGKVVGLSKLARTVETFARRPQMQERLTNQIADALEAHLGARGVAVVVEGEHYCMKLRGAKKEGATMVTSSFRGVFKEDPDMKLTVLSLLSHPPALQDMWELELARDDFDTRYPNRQVG